jgi:hypothetical protein
MTRPLALVASVIVVVALAVPSAVEAQAQRRGGSDSGSSSGDGGGSRGGDSGGGSVAMPRSSRQPSSAPAPVVRERPTRPASVGGAATRPSGSRPATGPDGRVSPAARSMSPDSAATRVRNPQGGRGVAQPRTNVPPPLRPSWDRWNRWSPWYGYGYGYSYGYGPGYYGHVVYNPWVYGGSSMWGWNRYAWHDPFLYDPYGYAGYPYYWSTGIDVDDDDDRDQGVPSGSLRLRVSPSHARVYIDGALAGVASEFGGLSNHLALPAGPHEIELRAEGYVTFSGQVDVRAGRTQTERITLKKM